jgi:hypothetical protein
MSSPKEAMVVQAVRLAYFIHRDKEIASRIAAESLIKLKAVAVAQDRRFLYEPSGRSSLTARARNKIALSELHLLQRIVYHESEPYERETERLIGTTALDEQRLIIHFIKHLVSITLKRNSFYATLGITRLLCHYTTAEAMELYNLVVQDPARVKDDYYWRSRKGHLMQDMKERFVNFVTISRGLRGEERFLACDDSSQYAPLVKECLDMFTPWKTSCPLPPGSHPASGELSALHFTGTDPDQEHRIELSRMHAVFHLDCLERLLSGLTLPAFFNRLEVPRFFFAQGNDGIGEQKPEQDNSLAKTDQQSVKPAAKSDNSSELPELPKLPDLPDPKDIDLSEIERRLDEYDESRQRTGAIRPDERLRVLVDGIERATLEPGRDSQVSLEIGEGAEMIEVRTAQSSGDVLLAMHLLSYDELQRSIKPGQFGRPSRFVTKLERGRNISFTITPARPVNNEPSGVNVEIGYQETPSILSFESVWARLQRWLPLQAADPQLALMQYALPILLIAVTACAIWLYFARQSDSQSPLIVKNATPTPVIAPSPAQTQSPPSTGHTSPGGSAVIPKGQGKFPLPNGANSDDTTRDSNATATAVSLLAVQKIYIELAERQAFAPVLRDQLNKELLASRRWTIASSDDADAALMVTTTSDGRGVIARLVNEDGRVIWNQRKRIYRGTPEQIARQIVADLLMIVRQSEKTKDRR